MRFNVADGGGINLRQCLCHGDDSGLSIHAWGSESDFIRTIIVDGGTANDR